MAKSLYEINLNYTKALQQASELESIARELRQLSAAEFQGCLDKVSANWKGENATKYIRKGKELQRKMDQSAKDLKKTASTIRSIARRTKEADTRAYHIAMSSGAGGGGGMGGR